MFRLTELAPNSYHPGFDAFRYAPSLPDARQLLRLRAGRAATPLAAAARAGVHAGGDSRAGSVAKPLSAIWAFVAVISRDDYLQQTSVTHVAAFCFMVFF